ncbi:hypothetical protein GQ44DRAFT_697773 [Phaeosphaeriaceae sp. PMI808]|nr:hypothetical protein GQ44DRAFT_697773 [Phaeosphaeriaceae sp. PMI808]
MRCVDELGDSIHCSSKRVPELREFEKTSMSWLSAWTCQGAGSDGVVACRRVIW